MAGEALQEASLGWTGIAGDRQWSFVARGRDSRFPWFTGRDHAGLVRYRPFYADPANPKESPLIVEAPDGWTGPIGDPRLLRRLEEESGHQVSLIQLGRGAYDAMPVSIVSRGGHEEVEAAHGAAIDPRRFRINIVVDTDMPLRVWAGRRLTFGEEEVAAQVAVTEPIQRCVMITIDPDTGARDPWLMRTVAQQFGNTYGVYANVVRPGLLRAGAPVYLSD
jgi:hypothetical protein